MVATSIDDNATDEKSDKSEITRPLTCLQIRLHKLNADKHSPASSARSTKRRVRGMLLSVGVESSH